MNNDQWQARRGLITGSRIAKLAGVSRFGGPFACFMEMTAEQMPEGETEAQRRGKLLEPVVIEWWHSNNRSWLPSLLTGKLLKHENGWAACTPDAVFLKEELTRVIEAKTASGPVVDQFGAEGTDEIPFEYICQTQWEMGVTGIERCDVPVLLSDRFAGFVFRNYVVRFDQDLWGRLLEIGERFMVDHVRPNRPPPPDNPDEQAELLARQFPKVQRPQPVEADAQLSLKGQELSKVRAELAALEERKKALSNEIKDWLGDRKAVVADGWKASWYDVKGRAKTDWETIARSLGASDEMIQQHTGVGSGTRAFKFTSIGDSQDE